MDRITEDKIKSAANVVEVVGDFIELRRRGVEFVGLCPFHDDKTLGNFSVNPVKGMYKCFACGAGGDAIKFLMEYRDSKLSYGDALRWLAKKYSISIPDDHDHKGDERWRHITPSKPKAIHIVERQPILIPREWVKYTRQFCEQINFVRWFRALRWDEQQRQRVDAVLWEYCVGGWTDGRIAFWQIDEQGQPHSAKLMRYQDGNGKRVRTENPGWLHNQQGLREYYDQNIYQHHSCLFGLHLTRRYPQANVHIVESEKTALIMAVSKGNLETNLWMACGGLQHFKPDMVLPLVAQGRKIYLWPDKDGVDEWKAKQQQMPDGARTEIYTGFIDRYWIEQDGPKADLADITLRLMDHPDTLKPKEIAAEAVSRVVANDPRRPDGVSDEEWLEHLSIMKAIKEWQLTHAEDEPFYTNTPLQQLLHDRVEESKQRKKQLKQQQKDDRRPEDKG